jgi:hypothetical protein
MDRHVTPGTQPAERGGCTGYHACTTSSFHTGRNCTHQTPVALPCLACLPCHQAPAGRVLPEPRHCPHQGLQTPAQGPASLAHRLPTTAANGINPLHPPSPRSLKAPVPTTPSSSPIYYTACTTGQFSRHAATQPNVPLLEVQHSCLSLTPDSGNTPQSTVYQLPGGRGTTTGALHALRCHCLPPGCPRHLGAHGLGWPAR